MPISFKKGDGSWGRKNFCLAAEARRYGSGETIPWQERVFPLSDFAPVDFYAKCYEYFAMGKEPFVPVAETREVMRVMDACRRDAGWEA